MFLKSKRHDVAGRPASIVVFSGIKCLLAWREHLDGGVTLDLEAGGHALVDGRVQGA